MEPGGAPILWHFWKFVLHFRQSNFGKNETTNQKNYVLAVWFSSAEEKLKQCW